MNSNWLEVQNIRKFLWIFFNWNWNQTHGFTMQRGFTVLAPTHRQSLTAETFVYQRHCLSFPPSLHDENVKVAYSCLKPEP